METREITIRVDAEAARVYAATSVEERRKIDLLLGLKLGEIAGSPGSLERAMRKISERSQTRGLTEERLNEILRREREE